MADRFYQTTVCPTVTYTQSLLCSFLNKISYDMKFFNHMLSIRICYLEFANIVSSLRVRLDPSVCVFSLYNSLVC